MNNENAMRARRRLKVRADELGLEFQQAVLYYAMERFLFRLSQTVWAECFVVKGAVMLRVWDAAVARPTRDIDFLGRVENTPEAIREIVVQCIGIPADDGLSFGAEVETVPITVEDRYPGVRAKVVGDLGGARFVLRLDVGIDDMVVPAPSWVEYPTLLGDDHPRILAYQPATAVAEKFQAMIEIGLANSRMKDYHDVWMLSRSLGFCGADLAGALHATFAHRGTEIPDSVPTVLTTEYSAQPEVVGMWSAYRRGVALAGDDVPESLQDLSDEVAGFLMPVVKAVADGDVFDVRWKPGVGWTASS